MGGRFAELIGKRKAFPYGFPDAKPPIEKIREENERFIRQIQKEDV